MKFTTRSLFLIITFYSLIAAIVFSMQSLFGVLLMKFIALFVLPPFIQVGAFTNRGLKQGFFIGAAVGGIPHFLFSIYVLLFSLMDETFYKNSLFEYQAEYSQILVVDLVLIVLASIGGVSGFVSYGFFHGFSNPTVSERKTSKIESD